MPSPITITGTLDQITGTQSGTVEFRLENYYPGCPRIAGTALLVSAFASAIDSGSGFSITLWGNDNITPANTFYEVVFRDPNGLILGNNPYLFVGAGPINLNTAIPLSLIPAAAGGGISVIVIIGGVTATLITLAYTATAPGNLTVPHTLGKTPIIAFLRMTSLGEISINSYDASNLYITASDTGVSCVFYIIG